MPTRCLALIAFWSLFLPLAHAEAWHMQPVGLQTRWASQVSPTNAHPEYPRPQLVRPQWQNLNGLWNYAITANTAGPPRTYDGKILVPYPIESALSGVEKPLQPNQLLWYERSFAYAPRDRRHRTLLHFGAVDWRATVYVNGKEVGTHEGGYEHFTFDITDALNVGENELRVEVYDPTDQGPNPHGKQTLRPAGIMYTATSGIWQTVWLETVPDTYIEGVTMTPDIDAGVLHLKVKASEEGRDLGTRVIARIGGKRVSSASGRPGEPIELPVPHEHLWSPDDPFLYDLDVELLKRGRVVDTVTSYFGMRKVEVKKDEKGFERIFLNHRYTYNLGTLDQGFWPDGIYTAPTDAASKFDIQAIKAMGFNTIRKHIKVEPDRWYYYCDKLGILVWQDMVNPGNDTPEGRHEFESEVNATVAQLRNHPSIITWVLFNEGWGAYDQARLTKWLKGLDPSRLVDGHTGENLYSGSPKELDKKWPDSDLVDIHNYPPPAMPPRLPGKASVLGEYGGIGVFIDGHIWNDLAAAGWGYVKVTPDRLASKYAEMVDQLKAFEAQGLSGSIYTQPFDVEGEQNGLITYDRAVAKIPFEEVRRINSILVPTAQNMAAATAGITIENADLRPEAVRYAELIRRYDSGDHRPALLRHLTLLALRRKDQARATAFGNEYLGHFSPPLMASTWKFIGAVTRTTHDRGFDLLQENEKEADAALGDDTAEHLIRGALERTHIHPRGNAAASAP